jgi:hypothetical protein
MSTLATIDADHLQALVADLDQGILEATELLAEHQGESDRAIAILVHLGGVRMGLTTPLRKAKESEGQSRS